MAAHSRRPTAALRGRPSTTVLRIIILKPSSSIRQTAGYVYAGTYNGGVFKTLDRGDSWTAINTGLTNYYVKILAIDPANSQTVYVGTSGGVFKTTNGGDFWIALNIGGTTTSIYTLAIDPADSRICLCGDMITAGSIKTTDGGASWMTLNTGLTSMAASGSLAVDPANSQIVYAGTNSGGVFKTTNGGASWTPINTGITNTDILSLAIDPANSRTVYAGTSSRGIFKTTNGGTSWTEMNAGLTSMGISTLAIDPNSRTIYAGTGVGVFKMVQEIVPEGSVGKRNLSKAKPSRLRELRMDKNRTKFFSGRRVRQMKYVRFPFFVVLFTCCLFVFPGTAFSEGGYQFVAKWGTDQFADGQLRNPLALAVDAAGNVYVVDAGNSRIQKFSSAGAFITKWGSHGSGDGQFNSPRGIAVDAAGNVYVTDMANNRIQKFSPTGGFITKWGSEGSGNGQFKYPGV